MTPIDFFSRESIRQTIAQYTVAGDRLKTDEFIAVFTDDAVLETEFVPDSDHFSFTGKEAILAWMKRWLMPRALGDVVHKASFIRHHLSTCHIELVSPTQALGRTYWTAYTDIGPDHCGYYVDEFQRVNDCWLIKHRKIRLDWRSPDSLYYSAVQRTR